MIKLDAEIHLAVCPACGSFLLWLSGQRPEWHCGHVGFSIFDVLPGVTGSPRETRMIVLEEGIQVIKRRMGAILKEGSDHG